MFAVRCVALLGVSAVLVEGDTLIKRSPRIYSPGNVMLDGLAPVHYPPGTREEDPAQNSQKKFSHHCGGPFNFRGLQHAEAILYAVDQINKNKTLLPGVTLGVDIKDTCNSVDHTIRESLQFGFIRAAYTHAEDLERIQACGLMKNGSALAMVNTRNKGVAIIGAAYSGITIAVANLAGLFHVPVVSYASTSRLLSDRSRFKNFLRTVPSDTRQAQVMVDIIREFDWNFVSTVASDTEYGRSGIESFKYAANSREHSRICIAVDEVFTVRTPKAKVREIFSKIREHPEAKVIVLFAELNDADYFINVAREENMTGYIWIGSDAFARSYSVLRNNQEILKYFINVEPKCKVYEPFKAYFQNITVERLLRNPWLRAYQGYIEKLLNLSEPTEYSAYTTTAIDAVYAVAYGLHDMYRCSNKACFVDVSKTVQRDVYGYIKNASFVSPTGHRVSFDESGSSEAASYNIIFVNNRSGGYHFQVFGNWSLGGGLKYLPMYEYDRHLFGSLHSFARCSPTCGPGFWKEPKKHFPECCWNCVHCHGNSVTNQSGATACVSCPDGSIANHEKSSCDVSPVTEVYSTRAGIAVATACGVGICAVFITSVTMFKQRKTPVVKAASREISYILLSGLAWCYTLPITFILQPTSLFCNIQPFLMSTGIAMVIGSLLTKTNRIARIFSVKTMRTGKTYFLSNKWQLVFVFLCAMMENSTAAIWIIISPRKAARVTHGQNEVTLECVAESLVGVTIWATFNAALILLCTYQAFLVRKVPENYNEAKFITFSMVTMCISGAVFVPTSLGTKGFYRTILTCFLVILCCSMALICLFGPKLYIIFFRPEKNQPHQPHTEPRSIGNLHPQYIRSISSLTTLTTINSLESLDIIGPRLTNFQPSAGLQEQKAGSCEEDKSSEPCCSKDGCMS
ncbi:metabotropic glutamate receptor 2-like [Orbicella faveolata]|uniref:metabotropic glutamate receptor 2-like n=1 Tax=Orbicella faveolata TaxID=48498 RepID=UPI0009E36D36|nr:metabotropic glutamate receptor 2-like [Orbicella faveolata]